MNRHPASIPRAMFWSHRIPNGGTCPQCHQLLEKEHHVYLIAVRNRGEIDTLIAGGDYGSFCKHCPTVVLDRESLSSTVIHGINTNNINTQYTVLGILDMEAIPPDKMNSELGTDDNPMPLVRFTNIEKKNTADSKRVRYTLKPKSKRTKRRK